MVTVSEAKLLILTNTAHLDQVVIGLEEASGHILAKDIYAKYDIPAFKQSSMDGYAIKFNDHSKDLALIGEMAAGANAGIRINDGETSRIFTGAPLPEGADTVVMQEKTSVDSGRVAIHDHDLKQGSNVRPKGSEITEGALAMSASNLLTPAAIGFLAGIGMNTVEVYPMPKVSIIVTGKELQQPGLPLGFGQVYESNSYSLCAALKNEGIDQIRVFQADDDLELLVDVLAKALAAADVVLLTGGVSVGDYDFVVEASAQCGIQQIFHKVKQKPGKPLYFGKKDRKLVFGLPGNPSSVLSCYYNYVLPCLKQLSNKDNSVIEVMAELTHPYKKASGLTHFLKGIYESGKVSPLSAQESYRLSTFAQANCLICIQEAQTEVAVGTKVKILLLPS